MARLFPNDPGTAALSPGAEAELDTLDTLRTALPEDYTVFHGVHWADEHSRGSAFGELDFVVVNRAGAILLVEQKGGRLEETGDGLVKDYGNRRITVADQVHRAVNHVQAKYASVHPGERPEIDYLLYLPHHRLENANAAGLAAGRIVHAASDDTLAERIERVLGPGRADDIRAERTRAFFRQELDLVPSVTTALAAQEKVYTRLAEGLAGVADRLDMHPWRLRVTARAGAGKTQLALRFLQNRTTPNERSPLPLAGEGQGEGASHPLYLCFNRALAENMETLAENTDVHTFHDFCRRILESAGEPFEVAERGHEPGFWEEIVERTREHLMVQSPTYDTLVVDEGQDFDPEWYETIRLCLTDAAAVLWLEDPLQNLHGREPTRLEGFAIWHTQENHRSTRAINRYIERNLGVAMESANDLPGDPVEHIAYREPDDQIELAGEHVQALIARGYAPEQIAILTVHGLERSAFARVEQIAGERLQRTAGYTADGHRRLTAGRLNFDSIHRYKGQEAPAVILADVDFPDWREERARKVLYTAMTRAGLHLCVLHAAEMAQ